MATKELARRERSPLNAHTLAHLRRGVLDVLYTHDQCLEALTEPNVHALRLAARHLQPVLQMLQALVPEDRAVARAMVQVRGVLHHTSVLREHHVYRIAVAGLAAPAVLRSALARAHALEERAEAERVDKRLRKLDRKGLVGLAARAWPCSTPTADRRALQRAVVQRRSHLQKRIAMLRADDPKALHKARVALKRYRYLLDTFAPYLPDLKPAQRNTMKQQQAQLGRWHDERILANRLMAQADQLPPAQRQQCLRSGRIKATWCAQEQERLRASLALALSRTKRGPPGAR